MGIIIENKDSPVATKQKLEQASQEMRSLVKKDILSLCGSLKEKLEGDPVDIIRKVRDEE